ncbi:MAG: CDP-glycerol glycerophosphotransferase family protein [Parasporobacterium sp.]|nr:CDP-glycerol glycerophosphotransferase family protein [Parasporobacterium sp.]
MWKNKKGYKRIKQGIFNFIGMFTKPCIIFESQPPFSDNTKPVYDELVRRGFLKKFKMVWYIKEHLYAELHGKKAVYYKPEAGKGIIDIARRSSIFYKTKAIICCNSFLPSSGPLCQLKTNHSKSFYLSHGIPIKSVNSYYQAPDGIDYALSPGKDVTRIMAKEFSIKESKFFVAGYPRNDAFAGSKNKINISGFENAKIIIWYPTYRQHKNQVAITKGSALPLIHEQSNLKILNSIAKEHNTVIIFKPHFVQDTLDYQSLEMSNILFIDDSFFEQKKITSYELLNSSDALITDYSSVYFDYTLCDKPIAVVWEDYKEYKEFPGFAIDTDKYMKGAVKVFTIDDLCKFVIDVANGIDSCRLQRQQIRDMANDYSDGRNAERTADFIIEKAGL